MRGQSGIEFIVLLGFLMMVFLGFSMVIQDKITEQHRVNQRDLSVQLADLIERELLLAARVNPGYSRDFDLPLSLGGEGYNVSLEGNDTLVINRIGEEYIRFLSVNVTRIFTSGGPVDERIVDFQGGHRTIYIQKNIWGCLYINRDCVEDGWALHECPVSSSETCAP
ncbi:hypothetical protein GOV07_02770 [Candidatus Woesearchaeota archaeon]|nr:hypothetical protein [Candidatus Woesearchaeota archaeon]